MKEIPIKTKPDLYAKLMTDVFVRKQEEYSSIDTIKCWCEFATLFYATIVFERLCQGSID